MIILRNVSKTCRWQGELVDVLVNATATIPADRRIAFFNPAEYERGTVFDILAGFSLPAAGRIIRNASVSFPVGAPTGFSPKLSVRENLVCVAQLYGMKAKELIAFVGHVGELSDYIDRPYWHLPSHVRQKIGILVSFAIPFDVYLFNREFTRLKGMPREFASTMLALVDARAQHSGMIIATEDSKFAREYCDMAMMLHDKQVLIFENVEDAILFASTRGDAKPPLPSGESSEEPRFKSHKALDRQKQIE